MRELLGFEGLAIERLHVSGVVVNATLTKINTVPTVIEIGTLDFVLRVRAPADAVAPRLTTTAQQPK